MPNRPDIPAPDVPPELLEAIGRVAKDELRHVKGGALAAQVAELSRLYTQEREAIGGADASKALLSARLRFFLPRDLPKILGPLQELGAAGALPEGPSWRVLDLGAGLGTTTFGLSRYARTSGAAERLDVCAVDRFGPGLELMAALAKRGPSAGLSEIALETRVADFGRAVPRGPFDFILFGLSLNEWARSKSADDAAALVDATARRLAPGGAMIIIEPALRPQARFLQSVRDAIVRADTALSIFAPCVGPGACPMLAGERDWCHAERAGALPPSLAQVARAAGLRGGRATHAYLTLRREPGTAAGGERAFRVVSGTLRSKGKHELHLCDGAQITRFTRLKRHASRENEAFVDARRGDLLFVDERVLVAGGRARVEAEHAIRSSSLRSATNDE